MENMQTLYQSIEASLTGKKFLLVLDDVWEEDSGKWEKLRICLKVGDPESRILVTTRKEEVVRTMGTTSSDILKPRLMSDLDCWLLMKETILLGGTNNYNDELEDIGKEIAKKCKGLPLAAKMLGGLLISKDSIQEWEEVLETEIWKFEKAEVELFPHIFLSYQELPSVLKRCFLILALFPKDTQLYVEKVTALWKAHGYLNPRIEQGDMIKTARKYLKFLVSRAFLEEVDEDEKVIEDIVVSMHDIMHDFALHILRDELLSVMVDNDIEKGSSELTSKKATKHTKAHHLIIRGKISPTSIGYGLGKLCTCIINKVPSNITSDLVKRLKMVRFLNLQGCDLKQVPKSIVNLIHLRTLILSDNPLVELPKTIGNLYNLQHLWLEGIESLSTIPQSLGKLVNLISLKPCHLALQTVPESVRKLINLQSLNRVYIGARKSKLEFMKDLNQLRDLEIWFKREYKDEVDAKKAAIGRKKHITRLALICSGIHNVTDGVLAALQPPPSIQTLEIVSRVLPNWITSLHHLKVIKLERADASTLPPLWKLESLEKILISKFRCLEIIGKEFLGMENNPNKKFCAFPKLVELIFSDCYELMRFEDLTPEEEGGTTVMPKLQILNFKSCRKLVKIPFRLIRQAPSLKKVLWERSTESWFDFDVKVNADGVAGEVDLSGESGALEMIVKSSRKVPISTINHNYITLLQLCHQEESILDFPPMGKLPCLQKLIIRNFQWLTCIGRQFLGIDNQEFVAFPSLVTLKIASCWSLEYWEDLKPEDEGKIIVMPKLENLKISRCPKFKVLPPRLLKNLPSSLKVLIRQDD